MISDTVCFGLEIFGIMTAEEVDQVFEARRTTYPGSNVSHAKHLGCPDLAFGGLVEDLVRQHKPCIDVWNSALQWHNRAAQVRARKPVRVGSINIEADTKSGEI